VLFSATRKKLLADLLFVMGICKLNDLSKLMSDGQRLLGLDVGKKTIGIAISDCSLTIASPLSIIWRTTFTKDTNELIEFIERDSIGGLIVGWPLNMNGKSGPSCDMIRDFSHALLKLRDIPLTFQDERLSTKAVERTMIEANLSRKKRRKNLDSAAACWILQSAIDRLKYEMTGS